MVPKFQVGGHFNAFDFSLALSYLFGNLQEKCSYEQSFQKYIMKVLMSPLAKLRQQKQSNKGVNVKRLVVSLRTLATVEQKYRNAGYKTSLFTHTAHTLLGPNVWHVILACPVLLTFSFKIVGCDITVNLPSVFTDF